MRQVYAHAPRRQFAFANGDKRAAVFRIDDVPRKQKQHRRNCNDRDVKFSGE